MPMTTLIVGAWHQDKGHQHYLCLTGNVLHILSPGPQQKKYEHFFFFIKKELNLRS